MQQRPAFIISAFEALSSDSLKNEESALGILEKISDPSCPDVYREQWAKYLAKMGFDSLVDSVLDKIEGDVNNSKVVFPLLGIIKDLKKTTKQKRRIDKVIEQILPQVNQDQGLNENLASLIKDMIDPDLINVISIATCDWPLNKSAGSSIIQILNNCKKDSVKTINALLRYVNTGQWNTNKGHILPNLNKSYSEKPIDVIRKTFENANPNYGECRNYLRQNQNIPNNKEAFVRNITKSLEFFAKECYEDEERLRRYLPTYFNELQTILVPLFKTEILNEDWHLCAKNCLYPLIRLSSKTVTEKLEALNDGLKKLINRFLSNPSTGEKFVERVADDWLVTQNRTPSKYILTEGCRLNEHRAKILEVLIRTASNYCYNGSKATKDRIQFQKWVSKDIVSSWKQESKEFLARYLTEDDVFNEWVYDTLHEHNLIDVSIIVKGLTSTISEPYTTKLLEDLIERYTSDAKNILVQNINNGRTPKIRETAAKTAGLIFDYKIKSHCPNSVLEALHERFTEQNKEVRETAYVSLGKICSEESIDPLLEAKSQEKKLEGVIKQSLDNIFARVSKEEPSQDNIEVIIIWIRVIGKLDDKRGFQLVKPFVDPSTAHPEKAIRIAVVEAIGRVGSSQDIPFLEKLRAEESHLPKMVNGIDRAIGFISNIGDFELLEIMRNLTDKHPTFSDPKLDLAAIFGDKAETIKSQCHQAYKSWLSGSYSLYATLLDNVCDLISKRILDAFKDELFQDDDRKYVSLRRSSKVNSRYEFLKSKADFKLIGSCFGTVHALRVEAPIPHAEDSQTERPKTELSAEDGQLAKDNFINAITKSVQMLKKKVFSHTDGAPSTTPTL